MKKHTLNSNVYKQQKRPFPNPTDFSLANLGLDFFCACLQFDRHVLDF